MIASFKIAVVSLSAALAACSKRGHDGPPLADTGVIITVPNQLPTCKNLGTCEDACRLGSAADCLTAANSYSTGTDAGLDEARAASLLDAACSLRSGSGCNLAGRMYEFGHGVPVDAAKALSMYERSCKLDYMGGCYNVAVLNEAGRGTPKDLAKAAAMYRAVCAAGSQASCDAATRLDPPK